MSEIQIAQDQVNAENGDWLDSLKAVADLSDKAKAARMLGYSRTAVSLALSGKYPAKTDKLEAAVRHVFMRPLRPCPAIEGQAVSVADCCAQQADAGHVCPETCPALALNQNTRFAQDEARDVA